MKKRRDSGVKGENKLRSRKNKPQPLEFILPRPQRKSSRSNALNVIRKATIQIIASNLKKTCVGLGNLYTGD